MKITVETLVKAPLCEVWLAWTTPADIIQWNAASADWHTPKAEIDLREGGHFAYRMEAKDGSMGFDFSGKFSKVENEKLIEFSLEDDRMVLVEFIPHDDGTTIRETFDAENVHEAQQQQEGWQAILDNFARHVEARI